MPIFSSLIVAGGLGAAGSIGSALIGANASEQASAQQVALQKQALAQQMQMFDTVQTAANPLITSGEGIVNSLSPTLTSLLTPGANMTQTLSQIPGFQFAQDWGQKSVQNIGTTEGLGGNVLTAGANYATGLAQQGYGSLVGNLISALSSGGGIASAGLNPLASAAGTFGNQAGTTLTNMGNAQAAGTLGSANALSGGLTGTTSSLSNSLLLSSLLKGGNANTAGGALSGGTIGGTTYPVNPGYVSDSAIY